MFRSAVESLHTYTDTNKEDTVNHRRLIGILEPFQ